MACKALWKSVLLLSALLPCWVNGKCIKTLGKEHTLERENKCNEVTRAINWEENEGELGMVGHTCNARTLEAEAGGLRAQGQTQLQSRFKPA